MARRGITKPADMEAAIKGTDSGRPTNDEISQRAYAIYVREGRVDGRDMDNWLRAEAELNAERQSRAQSAQGNGAREQAIQERGNGKNISSSTRPAAAPRRAGTPEKAGV